MIRLFAHWRRGMTVVLLLVFLAAMTACQYYKTDPNTGKRYQIDRREYEELRQHHE